MTNIHTIKWSSLSLRRVINIDQSIRYINLKVPFYYSQIKPDEIYRTEWLKGCVNNKYPKKCFDHLNNIRNIFLFFYKGNVLNLNCFLPLKGFLLENKRKDL